jgi:sulfate adenylyltransferase subunit 1
MDILRLITAGNVDDGKSTLLGRLLYDTQNIKQDILQSVSQGEQQSLNLAYITDGLRAERLQGITIDVAYKYFTTEKRKFILIDAPGHVQYTKNLVTGASGADLMIILVDVTNGISEQTRRHALVASFLSIKHIVVVVNKMDLVEYDEQIFLEMQSVFQTEINRKLQFSSLTFIPVSALLGDNIDTKSSAMPWYQGATLMDYLSYCNVVTQTQNEVRFSVQYCASSVEATSIFGNMQSGILTIGDELKLMPQNRKVKIGKILNGYDEVASIYAGQNATLFLEDDIVVRRGNVLVNQDASICCDKKLKADIFCLHDNGLPLSANQKYLLLMNGNTLSCTISELLYKIDVFSFEQAPCQKQDSLTMNEFGRVMIVTDELFVFDYFDTVAQNGRGILIDVHTNEVIAAFTIVEPHLL